MQQRENTLAQVRTPTEETPPVDQSKVAAVIVDQSEEMPSEVAQEQLDSFSSLDTFDNSTRVPRAVMKLQSEATTTTTTTTVHSTATLAAQALQIPALSESALLLLKTLRETANLDRTSQRPILDQHQSSDSDGLPSTVCRYGTESPSSGSVSYNNGPDMDHDEKVKILRALYAKRTRNKVSSSDIGDEADEEDSNEEQQQQGEATSEEKKQQNPVSDSHSQVVTSLTHGNNTVKVRSY